MHCSKMLPLLTMFMIAEVSSKCKYIETTRGRMEIVEGEAKFNRKCIKGITLRDDRGAMFCAANSEFREEKNAQLVTCSADTAPPSMISLI